MKNQLVKGMPKIEGYTKIEVIPNPIDTNLIIKNANKAGPGDLPKKYVVAAGRLIQLKGFDNLIYVFAEIRIKHPDLSLIILGDGPENKTLKDIIKKTKLDDAVILPGQVKNVYPYFKNASVCVVSSITEGFPNVLLQMMSQNNKVVSTLCAGGIEDIPGIYTCQTQNNEALREKIELALNTDKDNRDVFKDYLDIRSIKHFIKSMNYHLETYS
jgi:glycosyltransferase involved in cell wall biosynthesis